MPRVTTEGAMFTVPYEKSTTYVGGSITASGTVHVVAAPGAGTAIIPVIISVFNNGTAAVLDTVYDGTAPVHYWPIGTANAVSYTYVPQAPWKLTANTALVIGSDGSVDQYYGVLYYTEAGTAT